MAAKLRRDRRNSNYARPQRAQSVDGTLRKPQPDREQVRLWFLTCESCGHHGEVEMSLNDLRDAIAEELVYCRECGTVRQLRDR